MLPGADSALPSDSGPAIFAKSPLSAIPTNPGRRSLQARIPAQSNSHTASLRVGIARGVMRSVPMRSMTSVCPLIIDDSPHEPACGQQNHSLVFLDIAFTHRLRGDVRTQLADGIAVDDYS